MAKSTNNNLYLTIVYINIALYATCFQLQRPLEPFLVDRLTSSSSSDSKAEYARLQSFFSIVQTIGSLATGYYLDYFSVKTGFYASFLASALSYYLLSQSTTMNILYISKIPTVLQAGFLCAQLAVSHSTTEGAERMTTLGRLTFSYTIGMIAGPAIGGWVGASGDYYFGAKLAVVGSLLSVVLTYFLPPLIHPVSQSKSTEETSPSQDKQGEKAPAAADVSTGNSIVAIISKVWLFLFTKVATGVALSMVSSAFPLVLKNIFAFNESALGMAMSSLSIVNAIANSVLLSPFVQFLGGKMLLVVSFCLFWITLCLTFQSFAAMEPLLSLLPGSGLYAFMFSSYIITIFQFVLSPTLTGESTARVSSQEKGTLLGLEHSLFAAARILTPQAGVNLLNQGGISLVAGVAGGIFACVFALWEVCKGNLTSYGDVAKQESETPNISDKFQERKSK